MASSPLRRRSVDQPKGPSLSPAVGVQQRVGGVTGVVKQGLLGGGGGDDVNRDNSLGKVTSPLRRHSVEGSLEGLPSPAAGVVRQEGEGEEGVVRVFTAVEGGVSRGGGDAAEKEEGRDGDLPLQGEEVSSSLRVPSGVEPEGLPSEVTGAVQAVGVVQEVDGVAGGAVEEGAKDEEEEPKVRMDSQFVLRAWSKGRGRGRNVREAFPYLLMLYVVVNVFMGPRYLLFLECSTCRPSSHDKGTHECTPSRGNTQHTQPRTHTLTRAYARIHVFSCLPASPPPSGRNRSPPAR